MSANYKFVQVRKLISILWDRIWNLKNFDICVIKSILLFSAWYSKNKKSMYLAVKYDVNPIIF